MYKRAQLSWSQTSGIILADESEKWFLINIIINYSTSGNTIIILSITTVIIQFILNVYIELNPRIHRDSLTGALSP